MSKRIEMNQSQGENRQNVLFFYRRNCDVISAGITVKELRGAKFGWQLIVFSHKDNVMLICAK